MSIWERTLHKKKQSIRCEYVWHYNNKKFIIITKEDKQFKYNYQLISIKYQIWNVYYEYIEVDLHFYLNEKYRIYKHKSKNSVFMNINRKIPYFWTENKKYRVYEHISSD